jgi:hypothetical protein
LPFAWPDRTQILRSCLCATTALGYPPDFDLSKSKELGLRIVTALAKQLGADITRTPESIEMSSSFWSRVNEFQKVEFCRPLASRPHQWIVKFHPPTPPFRNRPVGPAHSGLMAGPKSEGPAQGQIQRRFLFSRVQTGTPRNPTNIWLEGWRQVAQSLGERNFLASNLFGVRLSQDFIRAKS